MLQEKMDTLLSRVRAVFDLRRPDVLAQVAGCRPDIVPGSVDTLLYVQPMSFGDDRTRELMGGWAATVYFGMSFRRPDTAGGETPGNACLWFAEGEVSRVDSEGLLWLFDKRVRQMVGDIQNGGLPPLPVKAA